MESSPLTTEPSCPENPNNVSKGIGIGIGISSAIVLAFVGIQLKTNFVGEVSHWISKLRGSGHVIDAGYTVPESTSVNALLNKILSVPRNETEVFHINRGFQRQDSSTV